MNDMLLLHLKPDPLSLIIIHKFKTSNIMVRTIAA